MPDRDNVAAFAKLVVKGLLNPWGAAERAAELAIDHVVGQLPPGRASTFERLLRSVGDDVREALAGSDSADVDRALVVAGEALAAHGLRIERLIALRLDERAAVRETLQAAEARLRDEGRAGELCVQVVIPAVYRSLLKHEPVLAEIELGFKRAVLEALGRLDGLAAEVVQEIRRLSGTALLEVRHRALRPDDPPSAALLAEAAVVPFEPRREYNELLAWCADGETVALRVYTGPGGRGKTRLMLEVCKAMRASGWRTGFLADHTPDPSAYDALIAEDDPVLVVVDYAERRPDQLKHLLSRADRARSRHGWRLRIVLLARRAEDVDWWRELSRASAEVQNLLGSTSVTRPAVLPPLARTIDDRQAVFEHAREALAKALGKDPTTAAPAPALEAEHFDDVLYIHMAAAASLDGETLAGAAALLDHRLQREERAWELGLETRDLRQLGVGPVAEAMALATLSDGADSPSDARHLLARVPLLADQPAATRGRVADLLHTLYPGARYLEPLRPDLFGEHLVGRVLTDDDSLLDTAIGADVPPARILHALTVLTRLARRDPRWLRSSLARDVERLAVPAIAVASETGDPIGPVLADTLKDAPLTDPFALNGLMPEQTVVLREAAAVACRQCHRALRAAKKPWPIDVKSRIAGFANDLAFWLSALGRREEALEASQEAVALYRTLAASDPRAFEVNLAAALVNLGNCLSNLGRQEEALAATKEAVGVYRKLAMARPDAWKANPVTALNNLAARLSALGRWEEALVASEEAVAICRRLLATHTDAFKPSLALALTGLGVHLGNMGRQQDALAATVEAVGLYRELASACPDAFEPDLANALDNLGVRLSNCGRHQDAHMAAETATGIYRKLAAARPDAFRHDLARALDNLGSHFALLGQPQEALAASEEALEIWRELSAVRPEAFKPEFARALSNLATYVGNLGRFDEALAMSEKAVAVWRDLAAARPDAFEPDLAGALNNLGADLSHLGRWEEALAASEEAVRTLAPQFLALPIAFADRMEMAVRDYVRRAEEAGQEPDARLLGPIEEKLSELRGPER